MFRPEDEPGPSFTDVLRRVGLDPFAPVTATAGPTPLEIRHGTTIAAIRYADGVVMTGDRRATAGSSIAHRTMEKVHPADRHSGVAIAGAAGPAMEMVRLFQLQLEHYEKVEGAQLSLEGKANQLVQMVRSNLAMAHAGLRGGAAVRRLRRAAGRGAHLHLRPHRRPLRGDRLPRRRLRRPGRPHDHQAGLASGPVPRRRHRPGGAGPVAGRRRGLGHRAARMRCGASTRRWRRSPPPDSFRPRRPRSPSDSRPSSPSNGGTQP